MNLRKIFKEDASSSAFKVIDNELRIIGKFGQISIDDDRMTTGNPGATKARAAAIAAGALLALPQWPAGAPETLTDFNDLAQWIKGVCHD